MSKVGSDSSSSTRAHARRSYWVRSAVSLSTDGEKPTVPKKTGGKRFVEPYRLSAEQRALILVTLAERSVGDDESRNLFAAAMEYDLASCHRLTEPETQASAAKQPPDSKEYAALTALAAAAERLAAEIKGLNDVASQRLQEGLEATDRFQRSYGGDYLKSLRYELMRLVSVGQSPELFTPTTPREHTLSEEAHRFVLRAADAFEACFELAPDARGDSPFVAAVEAIVAATGIRVPTDRAILAQILDQG